MKLSAGILVYRKAGNSYEVLLVHPGGPFWAKKDQGAWSIPKGEHAEGEDPLAAAKREFREEIGQPAPMGEYFELGSMKRSDGKLIKAYGIEGNLDISVVQSNNFSMEWPPRSGKMQEFPEIDRAAWVKLAEAPARMHKGQDIFIEHLADHLETKIERQEPAQSSLF